MREDFFLGRDFAREPGKKLKAYQLEWNKGPLDGTRQNPRRPKVVDTMGEPCSWEVYEEVGCVFVSTADTEHSKLNKLNKQLTLYEIMQRGINRG